MGSLCIDNCSRVRGGSLGGKGIGKMSRGFTRAARVALIVALLLAFCVCCFGATGEVVQRKGFVAGTSGYVAKGPFISTVVNAASGSANPWDWTGTLGIMDGSDDFTVIDINLTNADHTGSGNTVQAIDINGITGDAHATETAIKVGAGWDEGINCQSPATLAALVVVDEATAARTVTSADFGKTIACSYAGATTITLPDPAAGIVGATFYVAQLVDQNLTIVGGSTADNNQIIADGVLTSDNVAFSTASHKIGAMCKVTCISATKWLITNASSCTMTVEAAD